MKTTNTMKPTKLFFTFAITVLWVNCHGNHKHKLDALNVMAPRLVDVEDYDKIIKQFSFSSKKEKAMKVSSYNSNCLHYKQSAKQSAANNHFQIL